MKSWNSEHPTYEVQKWRDKIFFFLDKVPGLDLHLNYQSENPFNKVNIYFYFEHFITIRYSLYQSHVNSRGRYNFYII